MNIDSRSCSNATQELRASINELTARIGFQFEDIFVMDGSKRSSHSNAFFTGFGKTKRIVLFDTLVEKQSSKVIEGSGSGL